MLVSLPGCTHSHALLFFTSEFLLRWKWAWLFAPICPIGERAAATSACNTAAGCWNNCFLSSACFLRGKTSPLLFFHGLNYLSLTLLKLAGFLVPVLKKGRYISTGMKGNTKLSGRPLRTCGNNSSSDLSCLCKHCFPLPLLWPLALDFVLCLLAKYLRFFHHSGAMSAVSFKSKGISSKGIPLALKRKNKV